jgi:hypothetical protein
MAGKSFGDFRILGTEAGREWGERTPFVQAWVAFGQVILVDGFTQMDAFG